MKEISKDMSKQNTVPHFWVHFRDASHSQQRQTETSDFQVLTVLFFLILITALCVAHFSLKNILASVLSGIYS
jgi:hypothetical protein